MLKKGFFWGGGWENLFLPNCEKHNGARPSDSRADSMGLSQGKIELQRPLMALCSLACAAVPSLASTSACWIQLLLRCWGLANEHLNYG